MSRAILQTSTFENSAVPFAVAAGIALVVIVVAMSYAKRAASQAGQAVGEALDPTAPSNLAYRGANAVGSILTGTTDGSFTWGSWFYDFTHENAPRADAPVDLDVPGRHGASGSW